MKNSTDIKKLFFGLEIDAAWMHPLPDGRIIEEENRHITLAFLGSTSFSRIKNELQDFPRPNFRLGLAGKCDQLLFLPEQAPRVVAGHIDWFDTKVLPKFHAELSNWLRHHAHKVETREFLSHVTLARAPFEATAWEKAFSPFPLIAKALHLYESVGNLHYCPVWSLPFLSPIEEIEHTADIAFHIRGEDILQLFLHAQMALAFKFPDMLHYFSDGHKIHDLDDLIIQLNGDVARADAEIGCPFKAISFHGDIQKEESGLLLWEMIVDV